VSIRSFHDKLTQQFYETGKVGRGAGWEGVKPVARRKLDMVHYAAKLDDLRSPPGNRLEPLSGKLSGLHSIRINDQWRVVFRWVDGGAEEVRICDYH
jgi:proteic killer suppression protein